MLLTSQRLILRPLSPRQVDLWQTYLLRNRAFFQAYEPRRSERYFELDFLREQMEREEKLRQAGKALRLFLFHQQDYEQCCILGDVCYSEIQRGALQSCYLGYKIDQRLQGQGFAREALKTANDYMFKTWKLHRIEAHVLPENQASIRLLQALNFECEGLAKNLLYIDGAWRDHWRYALVNPNWQEATDPD